MDCIGTNLPLHSLPLVYWSFHSDSINKNSNKEMVFKIFYRYSIVDLQLTLSEERPWHILIATNKLKANMIHLIAVKSAYLL